MCRGRPVRQRASWGSLQREACFLPMTLQMSVLGDFSLGPFSLSGEGASMYLPGNVLAQMLSGNCLRNSVQHTDILFCSCIQGHSPYLSLCLGPDSSSQRLNLPFSVRVDPGKSCSVSQGGDRHLGVPTVSCIACSSPALYFYLPQQLLPPIPSCGGNQLLPLYHVLGRLGFHSGVSHADFNFVKPCQQTSPVVVSFPNLFHLCEIIPLCVLFPSIQFS